MNKRIEVLIEDHADGTKRVRATDLNSRYVIGEWWVTQAMPELVITITPDRCQVSTPLRSHRTG